MVKPNLTHIDGTDLSVSKLKGITRDEKPYDLPTRTYRKLGCLVCEFRGTSWCDYDVPRSAFRSDLLYICEKKYNLIRMFYDGDSETPSHRDLVMSYRKGMIELGHSCDWNRLFKIDDKIKKLETKLETEPDLVELDELKQLKSERDKIHSQVNGVGLELTKVNEKVLDREVRENQTKAQLALGLTDIHRIMRGSSNDSSVDPVDIEVDENE